MSLPLAAVAAAGVEDHREAEEDQEVDPRAAPEDHQAEEAVAHQEVVPALDQGMLQEGLN